MPLCNRNINVKGAGMLIGEYGWNYFLSHIVACVKAGFPLGCSVLFVKLSEASD